MSRPTTRSALLDRMQIEFDKLMEEVDRIPADALETAGACEKWSVKDILAHLDAWHEMFLGWDAAGSRGEKPDMPAPGFTWSETPALNDTIWRRVRDDGWKEVQTRLQDSYRRVRATIEAHDQGSLFEKRRFAWTGSTSVGSYAVSATSSHYAWATKLVRAFVDRINIRATSPRPEE